MIHKGKIGRLPAAIRDELNRRLFDGQPASRILPWLNGLPEVKDILQEDFEGLAVNDQNLSEWRNGGFKAWVRRRETVSNTRELADYSLSVAKAAGGNITEGAAQILAGKILEVLEGISELETELNERDASQPSTPEQAEARVARVAAMSEAIKALTDSLGSLRNGDQNNVRLRQNDDRLALLAQRLKQTQEALELEKQKFMRTTCELFVKWHEDKRAIDAVSGSGDKSEIIERLGQLMFEDQWRPATAK